MPRLHCVFDSTSVHRLCFIYYSFVRVHAINLLFSFASTVSRISATEMSRSRAFDASSQASGKNSHTGHSPFVPIVHTQCIRLRRRKWRIFSIRSRDACKLASSRLGSTIQRNRWTSGQFRYTLHISIGINYSLKCKRRQECVCDALHSVAHRQKLWIALASTITMVLATATATIARHLITGSSFTFHKFHHKYIDSFAPTEWTAVLLLIFFITLRRTKRIQVKHVCLSCNSIGNSIHIPSSSSSCFLLSALSVFCFCISFSHSGI